MCLDVLDEKGFVVALQGAHLSVDGGELLLQLGEARIRVCMRRRLRLLLLSHEGQLHEPPA